MAMDIGKILTSIQYIRNHRMPGEPIGYADLVEKKLLREKYDQIIANAEKERLAHPEKYEPINWANFDKKN